MIVIFNRFLGLGREILIAHKFGISQALDLYFIANTIPNIIISVFTYAIPFAYLPLFFTIKEESGEKEAWLVGWNFFNFVFIIFILLGIFLFAFAESIIKLLYPHLDIYNLQSTKALLQILSIGTVFGGIFSVLRAYFHSSKRFLIPALTPILVNLSVISSIFLFADISGNRSLAFGMTAGLFIQAVILFWMVGFKKHSYNFQLPKFNNTQKNLIISILIVFGIEGIGLSFTLIDRIFASQISPGMISSLSFASTIFTAPIAFIGMSLGVVVMPSLSEFSAHKDFQNIIRVLKKSFIYILIFTLPFLLLFLFKSNFIVKLLYEHGEFSPSATAFTSSALMYYSFGLIFYAFHIIFVRIYYALRQAKVLFFVTLLGFIIKLYLSYYLIPIMAHNGLALATSISYSVNVLLLSGFLYWKLKPNSSFLKI